MKMKLVVAAAVSLTVAACSTGPAPETTPGTGARSTAAAVNPLGRFEFTTTVQGQTVTGGLAITGSPGAYAGEITTSITPPLPVAGVAVNGQEMIVTGNTPDGVVTIRMTFSDADTFSGGWELAGDSGSLTGRRVT